MSILTKRNRRQRQQRQGVVVSEPLTSVDAYSFKGTHNLTIPNLCQTNQPV